MKCVSRKEDQSSMLQPDVSDFQTLAPFPHQSLSDATGVKNKCKIWHFLTLVEFTGGVGEMSE